MDFLSSLYDYAPRPDVSIVLIDDPDILTARTIQNGCNFWETGLEGFLDIPIKDAYDRFHSGLIPPDVVEKSIRWFIRTVTDNLLTLASRDPSWHAVVIDCHGLDLQSVHQRINRLVEECMNSNWTNKGV